MVKMLDFFGEISQFKVFRDLICMLDFGIVNDKIS